MDHLRGCRALTGAGERRNSKGITYLAPFLISKGVPESSRQQEKIRRRNNSIEDRDEAESEKRFRNLNSATDGKRRKKF
jgi:hypothetical protein